MRKAALALLSASLLAGCLDQGSRRPSEALFVGIDVSGSYQHTPYFDDSLQFLAQYLWARLNAKGTLQPVKSLYVGSIGGKLTEETKSFYPIEDFQGKTPDQIYADLKAHFPISDRLTDYGVFFEQVADIARKRNMALSPITIVLLTDGIPDIAGQPDIYTNAEVPGMNASFNKIDMSSLEYLSRKVTVRLLYPTPVIAKKWETAISRQRVRLWTVDHQVMEGWKAQFDAAKPATSQEKLWRWIEDNVDYRVRPTVTKLGALSASSGP